MHPALAPHDIDQPLRDIWFVDPNSLDDIKAELTPAQAAYLDSLGFAAGAGELALLTDASGEIIGAVFGLGVEGSPQRTPFLPGKLALTLPTGVYRFANRSDNDRLAALAFLLSSYKFTKFLPDQEDDSEENAISRIVGPEGIDMQRLASIANSAHFAMDLINRPTNDMGPRDLEKEAHHLATTHGAMFSVTTGEELLDSNFPLIHAVGRAAGMDDDRAPRLIDFVWGDERAPKVTLVGKGVCFDTGGLDLKGAANMLLMKKDMGGAANVLGLASMIMDANLPVRLRVLLPAVENSVSGNAFRPSDILQSRKGLSVEIGNTDAEGRLVLADALTLADEEEPDLIIDMATLTGAARVALGPDLPPFFTSSDELARAIEEASAAEFDPLWRLPLWPGYKSMLDSKIASVNNTGSGGFAGAITAALFLDKFVERTKDYVHFDVYGWRPSTMPGAPEGGAAQGIRALFQMLCARYAG